MRRAVGIVVLVAALIAGSLAPGEPAGAEGDFDLKVQTWDGRPPDQLVDRQRVVAILENSPIAQLRGQRFIRQCRAGADPARFDRDCTPAPVSPAQTDVSEFQVRTGEFTPEAASAPVFRCDDRNPCTLGVQVRTAAQGVVATDFVEIRFQAPPPQCPVPELGATELDGAGTVNFEEVFLRWVRDVCSATDSISFTGKSSPAGRLEYREGRADFAVTASPFNAAEQLSLAAPQADGSVNPRAAFVYIPIAITALAVTYNYFGDIGSSTKVVPVLDLKFSAASLAKIFTGRANRTELEPELPADNPRFGTTDVGRNLSSTARNGPSSWALQFMRYIYENDAARAAWESGPDDFATEGELAQYRTGVVEDFPTPLRVTTYGSPNLVENFLESPPNGRGADLNIGMLDTSIAVETSQAWAAIKNVDGYVTPTEENMLAAVESARAVLSDHGLFLDIDPELMRGNAYPLTLVSYMVVPTYTLSDAQFELIAKLIDHAYSEKGQQQLPPGYAPLPADLRATGRALLDVVRAARTAATTTTTTAPSTGTTTPGGTQPAQSGASTDESGDFSGSELASGFDEFGAGFEDDFSGGSFDSGDFASGTGVDGATQDLVDGSTPLDSGGAQPVAAIRLLGTPAALRVLYVLVVGAIGLLGGPLLFYTGAHHDRGSRRRRRRRRVHLPRRKATAAIVVGDDTTVGGAQPGGTLPA